MFQSRSICDRNTSVGAKGLWEWGSEPINSLQVLFKISSRKGAGRRRRERWPSKIDSNWNKHCCCSCWFSEKCQLNLIQNDIRIFEHPQDCSSSHSERGYLLSRFFSCCTTMCLPTKLHVFVNFWHKKMLQPFIFTLTVQIYIRQTILCSPSWKWN
jgi:hypothetical protein